jgi:hypothetical protein
MYNDTPATPWLRLLCVCAFLFALGLLGALSTGCLVVEELHYDHDNPQTYTGPVDQSTSTGDVAVDEVQADVDAEVQTEVNNDVDTDVDTEVNAETEVGFGEGGAEEPASGTTTAVGDGLLVEYRYEGPLSETVTLTPSVDGLAVDSVEWLARDVVFGEPIFLDDPQGFAWGEPQYEGGEYVLAARFGEASIEPLVWDASTAWCEGGACFGRAIEAACEAEVVLRAWLDDGSVREVSVQHDSPRPVCPSSE